MGGVVRAFAYGAAGTAGALVVIGAVGTAGAFALNWSMRRVFREMRAEAKAAATRAAKWPNHEEK